MSKEKRFRQRWPISLQLGAVLSAILVLFFFVFPRIWISDGEINDLSARSQDPSLIYPLGTDSLGRDLFARTVEAGRTSVTISFIAVLLILIIGVTLGCISGFLGGAVDSVITQVIDFFVVLPSLPILIIAIEAIGRHREATGVVLAFLLWHRLARIVRAEVKAIRSTDFVMAAKVSGATFWSVLRRHILVNLVGTVTAEAVFMVGVVLAAEATLGFLQVGSEASLGQMLFDVKGEVSVHPSRVVMPGLLLALVVAAANLLSRGIQDLLKPPAPGLRADG